MLFDIGGPIDTEAAAEQAIDAAIRAVAAANLGAVVSDADYRAAECHAVRSFAPNAYHAILWALLGDAAATAWPAVVARLPPRRFELRPGIAGLLHMLAGQGVRLGLAANQPAEALDWLRAQGLAGCFAAFDVSGTTGLRKPDPRVFLQAAVALGVAPEACIMVGDRIDNDIAPARALGLAAVRFRCGRHAEQAPRCWQDVPDDDVDDVPGLAATLRQLLQME